MEKTIKESVGFTLEAIDFLRSSFGRIFKAKREQAGLTQKQVAKRAHVRPETVSRIEGGKGNPTVDTLARLMRSIP